MLYMLVQSFNSTYAPLHFFNYISVRAILALFTSLATAFLCGRWFLARSERSFRSDVRKYTPESHQLKNNTPTMGGLFILLVGASSTLLWGNLRLGSVWLLLACMTSFAALGFIDDWEKITKRNGIRAKTKFCFQIACALSLMATWYLTMSPNTELCIPFYKNLMPQLGWLIIPWGAFVIVATSNAVNLTDGLDGLATGPLIANFTTFGAIAYLAGHWFFSLYLDIPFAHSSELVIVACALVGALLGFLWYNTYPAQLFMGDVGSLMLGACLGMLAVLTRQELLLPIAGGIFVFETVSVIIQVGVYKMTGKRVFRRAPVHHHFELLGWSEPKITVRFWIVSIILMLLALLTLKIR